MARSQATRPNPRAALFLAWLPLAVLLPIASSQLAADPIEGLWFGARSALVGAALMTGVWWLTGRFTWPERATVSFYLVHVVAAAAFAATWRTVVYAIAGLPSLGGVFESVRAGFAGPLVIWDLMLKITVYGLVIALSCALREAERARAEHVRAARVDALATRAQLAALRAQLNPHFLFNTLHSLSVLINREPAVAVEAVDRLGELLRFALRHGGDDDVTLADEYRFVRNYLAIERLRMEHRLRVVTDVDPRTLGLRVPPFCLQPVVENAIHHGLSPREDGGTLWIGARIESGVLYLEVRDDGVGASSAAYGPGSGLASLRQRLEARGGRLTVRPGTPQGFAVSVSVPLPVDAREDAVLEAASL